MKLVTSEVLRNVKINKRILLPYVKSISKQVYQRQIEGFKSLEWKTYELVEETQEKDQEANVLDNLQVPQYKVSKRYPENIISILVKNLREYGYDVKETTHQSLAGTDEKILSISWEEYLKEDLKPTEAKPIPMSEMDKIIDHLSTLDPGPKVNVYSASAGETPDYNAWIVFDKEDRLFYRYMFTNNYRIEEKEDGFCAYAQNKNFMSHTARQAKKIRDRFIKILENYKRPYSKEDVSE